MIIVALVSLVLGVVCGQFLFSAEMSAIFSHVANYALCFLMLLVGISIGMSKNVFKKLKEYNIRILIIPIGVIAGSIVGGFVCGWVIGMPLRESVPVASAMGWYSLAGVLLTSLLGAQVGAIAFLSSLMREMITFVLIPPIAKHLNVYTAIAPAGATSEDTTLPMLVKYTNSEVVVMAVFNGVLCSAAAPVLMRLFSDIL